MNEVLQLQRDIVRSYEDDMVKYAQGRDRFKIQECFQSIPRQIDMDLLNITEVILSGIMFISSEYIKLLWITGIHRIFRWIWILWMVMRFAAESWKRMVHVRGQVQSLLKNNLYKSTSMWCTLFFEVVWKIWFILEKSFEKVGVYIEKSLKKVALYTRKSLEKYELQSRM